MRSKLDPETIKDSGAIRRNNHMRGSGPPRGRGRRYHGYGPYGYNRNRDYHYSRRMSTSEDPRNQNSQTHSLSRSSNHPVSDPAPSPRSNNLPRQMETPKRKRNQTSQTPEPSPAPPPPNPFLFQRTSRDGHDSMHTSARFHRRPRWTNIDEDALNESLDTSPPPASPPSQANDVAPDTLSSSSSSTVTLFSTQPESHWRALYRLEKERLSAPRDSKPKSLYIFTDDRRKGIVETRSPPRNFTSAYPADQIFGTAPEIHAEVRDVAVTFSQIWNREMFVKNWIRHAMDYDGSLLFENQEYTIQLQRHHVPGTFYISAETGSLDINFEGYPFPDVYFRLVDKSGQEFRRSLDNVYDLKRRVEIERGQTKVAFMGIDGAEIVVDIEGRLSCRLRGHGMPRKWAGTDRGDLVVEFVRKARK